MGYRQKNGEYIVISLTSRDRPVAAGKGQNNARTSGWPKGLIPSETSWDVGVGGIWLAWILYH